MVDEVRKMTAERKKPGVAFWVTVTLIGLVLYGLSIGPVAWLVRDATPGDWGWTAYHGVYYPIHSLRDYGTEVDPRDNPVADAIGWYLDLWGGGPVAWLDT
jgi:hypothetical protein